MNSTIINKKKICVSCGRLDYWFSKKMCKQCATINSTARRIEKSNLLNESNDESLSNLIADLDIVFSKYIRLKYSNNLGYCECFTCGKTEHYLRLQCGHFISRGNIATRFLEENCRPQCIDCNEFKDGNISEFSKKLQLENNGILDWLNEQSKQIYKPTRSELKELIIEYRNKLNICLLKLKKE